jgi:tetratricopeptide (TPR) repeat protein
VEKLKMKKKILFIFFAICLLSCYVLGQDNVKTYIDKTRQLQNEGKTVEAESEISKAIGIAPDDADLYIKRAEIYLELKETDKMKQDLDQAISLDSNDEKTVWKAANVMYRAQIYGREYCSSAVSILDTYLANHANIDNLIHFRGIAKQCAGDLYGAYEDFSKASELKPDNSSYLQALSTSLTNIGDSPQALELLNKLISDSESRLSAEKDNNKIWQLKYRVSQFYGSRSYVFEKQGNTDAMFSDLNKMVEVLPKESSYIRRAMAYVRQKKFAEAINDYNEIIKLQPKQIDNYIRRGDLFFRVGKYSEAINDYEKAITLNENIRLKEMLNTRIEQARQKMKENK